MGLTVFWDIIPATALDNVTFRRLSTPVAKPEFVELHSLVAAEKFQQPPSGVSMATRCAGRSGVAASFEISVNFVER